MKRHIFHITLFLSILLVFLILLSVPFQKKHFPEDPAVMLEPDNTLDAIFIGNSEALYGYSPTYVWQEYGYTSFNCGTNNQKPYRTEDLLRIVFSSQSPKIVFVEPHMLYVSCSWYESVIPDFGMYLSVIRNHDQWKPLDWQQWFHTENPFVVDPTKGYYYADHADAAENADYMVYTDAIPDINPIGIHRMQRIKELCAKNNAELILVSIPSAKNWSYEFHNGIVNVAEELDLPYIDLNLLTQELGIDWNTDTVDKGDHLNFSGAKKVSEFIGKYMQQTGYFTDKRHSEAYAQWNIPVDDYLAFRERLK